MHARLNGAYVCTSSNFKLDRRSAPNGLDRKRERLPWISTPTHGPYTIFSLLCRMPLMTSGRLFFLNICRMSRLTCVLVDAHAHASYILILIPYYLLNSSLDSIGISAFQFDFGSISGQASRIANAVDAFAQLAQTPLNVVAPLFLHVFPFIYRVPTARIRMMLELHASLRGAGAAIIENYKQSKDDPAYAGSARLITSLGRSFAFSFIRRSVG